MNRLTKVALIASLFQLPVIANASTKTYPSVTVSEVTSIYDGDTFTVTIAGWPAIIGERIGIRINGIDTPEMRGKCESEKQLARKAKQTTVAILRNGKVVELRNLKRDKYFRIVADVYVDGVSIGNELTRKKLAVHYDGGTKIDWCNNK